MAIPTFFTFLYKLSYSILNFYKGDRKMNNIIITLISNKKNTDNMILEVDSYNVLLMYIDQLEDQEVVKRYDTVVINSRELVYNLCKEKLENSYNNISLEKSVIDDFVESIFNAINNLEYKIIYEDELREAC